MTENSQGPVLVGRTAFGILFLLAALYLLSQLGNEAKFSSGGKLFSQPAFWPGVGVLGMTLFGLAFLATQARGGMAGEVDELLHWLLPIEFLVWFMVYVIAVPRLGYLPSTIVFAVGLAYRAGYRNGRTLGLAALMGLMVVLVFKTALAVKIPGGAIYEYLPGALRNFALVNL